VLEAFAVAQPALDFARRGRVHVAIVDYQLEGRSGLWLCRRLRELPDPPAVVMYSAFSDQLLAAGCAVAGASALVDKSALGPELAAGVRDAAAGRRQPFNVAPTVVQAIGEGLEPDEQALFGLMLSDVPDAEIARRLRMRDTELDATRWSLLRRLDGVARVGDRHG
jgi:DNA-binding NarL/FixJ family response regulator